MLNSIITIALFLSYINYVDSQSCVTTYTHLTPDNLILCSPNLVYRLTVCKYTKSSQPIYGVCVMDSNKQSMSQYINIYSGTEVVTLTTTLKLYNGVPIKKYKSTSQYGVSTTLILTTSGVSVSVYNYGGFKWTISNTGELLTYENSEPMGMNTGEVRCGLDTDSVSVRNAPQERCNFKMYSATHMYKVIPRIIQLDKVCINNIEEISNVFLNNSGNSSVTVSQSFELSTKTYIMRSIISEGELSAELSMDVKVLNKEPLIMSSFPGNSDITVDEKLFEDSNTQTKNLEILLDPETTTNYTKIKYSTKCDTTIMATYNLTYPDYMTVVPYLYGNIFKLSSETSREDVMLI
jgi:hypothetical protein